MTQPKPPRPGTEEIAGSLLLKLHKVSSTSVNQDEVNIITDVLDLERSYYRGLLEKAEEALHAWESTTMGLTIRNYSDCYQLNQEALTLLHQALDKQGGGE